MNSTPSTLGRLQRRRGQLWHIVLPSFEYAYRPGRRLHCLNLLYIVPRGPESYEGGRRHHRVPVAQGAGEVQ